MIYDAALLQQMIAVFGIFAGISWLIYRAIERKVRGTKISRMYLGGSGMEPDDVKISTTDFYSSIERTLRVPRMMEVHDGDLSHYIMWIVIGLTVMIIALVWGML